VMHSVMIDTSVNCPTNSRMWFDTVDLLQFSMSSVALLNALMLPAMSSLTAMYSLVMLPYITLVVKFATLSYASACSTPVFYRQTVESILTGSLAARKTLTFSTNTDNTVC
jgi:hypothetical protein